MPESTCVTTPTSAPGHAWRVGGGERGGRGVVCTCLRAQEDEGVSEGRGGQPDRERGGGGCKRTENKLRWQEAARWHSRSSRDKPLAYMCRDESDEVREPWTSQYKWVLCVHVHRIFQWACECPCKVITHLHHTRKCTYITWREAHWKRSAQTSPTRSADSRETPAKIYVFFPEFFGLNTSKKFIHAGYTTLQP